MKDLEVINRGTSRFIYHLSYTVQIYQIFWTWNMYNELVKTTYVSHKEYKLLHVDSI